MQKLLSKLFKLDRKGRKEKGFLFYLYNLSIELKRIFTYIKFMKIVKQEIVITEIQNKY